MRLCNGGARVRLPLVLALVAALSAPLAAAHVLGEGGGGVSYETPEWLGAPPAREFGELPPAGGVVYHRLDLEAGQRVRARIALGEGAFEGGVAPGLVIAGPGLPTQPAPEEVEVPQGVGLVRFGPETPRAQTISWLPARLDVALDASFVAPETASYIFIVHDAAEGGRFTLFIETDAWSWLDLFRVPALRGEHRDWRGDAPWMAYAVGTLGAAAMLAPFASRLRARWVWSPALGAAVLAGVMLAASGALAARDAIVAGGGAAHWWPAFVALGAAGGILALALLRPPGDTIARIGMGILAVGAMLGFAGFVWGPVAGLVAAISPEDAPDEATGGDATPRGGR